LCAEQKTLRRLEQIKNKFGEDTLLSFAKQPNTEVPIGPFYASNMKDLREIEKTDPLYL